MVIAAIALAGCNAGPGGAEGNAAVANAPTEQFAEPKLVYDAKPVVLDSQTPLLDWHVSWPSEVSANPALVALIREPAEKAQAEYGKQAAADEAQREKDGFPWPAPYQYSVDVRVVGSAPRLLSLAREWSEYTGGAHPNHGTEGIIWDLDAGRKVEIGGLFRGGPATLDRLTRNSYCSALDAERKKRRGAAEMGGAEDPFWACPKYAELQIIPQGAARGALTILRFHADPYTAGPYAEGDYDIELPVTASILAALKPEYRLSFAARP